MKRSLNAEPSTSTLNKKPKTDKPTKLGDLNDNCLLEIFKDFSLTDLVNIVYYDVDVGNAARMVFNKRFRNQEMSVSNNFEQKTDEWSFKLLKYFGSEILKLRIEYKDAYRGVDYKLNNLILSKCKKSLKEIIFVNADRFTMNDIDEPFEVVHKVTFVSSKFCGLISNFTKWFPNAYVLYLTKQPRMELKTRFMLENHMPALRRFSIENTDAMKQPTEQNEGKVNNYNISTFIKLNPQLEYLSIYCDRHGNETSLESQDELLYDFDGIKMDHELLGTINTKLPNLKSLDIILQQHSINIKMPAFHFDELSSLHICFYSSTILDSFPISTGKLKNLFLKGNELKVNIFKFIEKHANVNVLKILGEWNPVSVTSVRRAPYNDWNDYERSPVPTENLLPEIIRVVPKLPYLNELHIPYRSPFFLQGQMLTLLSSCNSLHKLVIQADDVDAESKQAVTRYLQSLIPGSSEWKAEFTDDWVNFRRLILTITK